MMRRACFFDTVCFAEISHVSTFPRQHWHNLHSYEDKNSIIQYNDDRDSLFNNNFALNNKPIFFAI